MQSKDAEDPDGSTAQAVVAGSETGSRANKQPRIVAPGFHLPAQDCNASSISARKARSHRCPQWCFSLHCCREQRNKSRSKITVGYGFAHRRRSQCHVVVVARTKEEDRRPSRNILAARSRRLNLHWRRSSIPVSVCRTEQVVLLQNQIEEEDKTELG